MKHSTTLTKLTKIILGICAIGSVHAQSLRLLSGSLSVGYTTNYNWGGLVAVDHSGENANPLELKLNYSLMETLTAYTNIGYTAIWRKDMMVDQNQFKPEVGALYKLAGGWSIKGHYCLVRGGFAGSGQKKYHGIEIAQYVGSSLNYEKEKGVYGRATVNHYFSYTHGWGMSAMLGYKYKMTEKLSTGLELHMSYTDSYYQAKVGDGGQAIYAKYLLPYKFSNNISIIPFVGPYWLAEGGLDFNKQKGATYRNFAWVAGCDLVYTF